MLNLLINVYKKVKFMKFSPKQRAKYLSDNGMNIGSESEVFDEVSFGSEPYLIDIGKNVKITKGVNFITHDGGMHVIRNLYQLDSNKEIFGRIVIGDNVFIGNRVTIMPGVSIGDNCIVGVGSIVTKDVPNNSVVVGIPAKVICDIDTYYNKNSKYFSETKQMNSLQKKKFLNNELISYK